MDIAASPLADEAVFIAKGRQDLNEVLHKDVYWLGRQWAVTGYGIQAVDQNHKMKFDIEASRIGANNLDEAMESEPWFDVEDFKEASRIARKRLEESPQTFRPLPSAEK